MTCAMSWWINYKESWREIGIIIFNWFQRSLPISTFSSEHYQQRDVTCVNFSVLLSRITIGIWINVPLTV